MKKNDFKDELFWILNGLFFIYVGARGIILLKGMANNSFLNVSELTSILKMKMIKGYILIVLIPFIIPFVAKFIVVKNFEKMSFSESDIKNSKTMAKIFAVILIISTVL